MPTYLAPGRFTFDYVRLIGSGGLGRVDEIVVRKSTCDEVPGTHLGLKRLNPKWQAHQETCVRFEREIEAVKALSHPAIVPYRGENVTEGSERFYCMPLYPKNLRRLMYERGSQIPVREVAGFGAGIADALAYAHSQDFIHRDLKPENILLKRGGGLLRPTYTPVIADWGLGRFVHKHSVVLQHLTRGGMGTERYCSYEQWNNGECDGRGDVYSLGVTLAEMVLGRQPNMRFPGDGVSITFPSGAAPGQAAFSDLIRRMTAVSPDGRPDYMVDVAEELRQVASMR